MRPSPRLVFAAIVAACAGLLATAILYFQQELGLDPCPMCILSRFCFIGVGAISLAAAIHNPRGTALKVYAAGVALVAVTGVGISMRHSYLQHFPPAVESCGTDLEFLLNTFSLTQALPKIFAGTGSCSATQWKFLGLSIPEWAAIWFAMMAIAALWAAFARRRDGA